MTTLPETQVSTQWIKVPSDSELCFVGREVVCIGKGCHLLFYSLDSGEQKIYSGCTYSKGDGIKCYAGHRQLPLLAFAECCLDPRIIIIKYPEFPMIKIIEGGAPEGYIALAFSDTEYLVSLSSLPEYEFVVWNWRTREKLAAQRSNEHYAKQMLCCSFHQPLNIVQYYENSESIILWEVSPGYKMCMLEKHKIALPYKDRVINVSWNTEGTLFVLNNAGCIYMLTGEFTLDMIIYGPHVGHQRPCFTWYKGGLLVLEPNLGLKHFRKFGDWMENWDAGFIKLHQLITSSGQQEHVVCWTKTGEIKIFDAQKHIFLTKTSILCNVTHICWIYPLCTHFVSLCPKNNLVAWDATTGLAVSTQPSNLKIKTIVSNKQYPYIAAGLMCGTLILYSYYKLDNPSILARFHLNREEITKIVFSQKGDIIVTANMELGLFFIIRGVPGSKMQVLNYINYRRPLIDMVIIEDDISYKLIMLLKSNENPLAGQTLVMKNILKSVDKIKKKRFISPYFFTCIKWHNNVFYSKIFGSDTVSTYQLGKKHIQFLDKLPCEHFSRHTQIISNGTHFVSFGYDGMITVRNHSFVDRKAIIIAHHRLFEGVEFALVDPFLRYVISMGVSNELVCTKIHKKKIDERRYKETMKAMFYFGELFTKPTIGYDPEEDVTYLELAEKRTLIQEEIQYAKERKAIMEEFLILKREVVSLLEANLRGPDLEKIDILEFYLHTRLREYKEMMAEKECEWIVTYNRELIRVQNELWQKMKDKFWDTQLVRRTLLKGIFSHFHVENYGLIPDNPRKAFNNQYTIMLREFEEMLKAGDLFLPWLPYTKSAMQMIIEKPPVIKIQSESTRIMEALEQEEGEEEIDAKKLETYPSSNVKEFLEKSMFYEQEEVHTYTQVLSHKKLMANINSELRHMFNQSFNEMMQQKVRDMNIIIEKNNRLRFILSELKNSTITIDDPQWEMVEQPDRILTVADHELSVKPYISPSQQALLDEQAAEEERIRLLLLADDFRERALMKMMDGVLEIRWEDTLKRDIPKPKCLIEKQPENYNEEDLRAIKDYEEKVIFLNSERQRYKNMLEQEYGKIAEFVRETIKKFNHRLRELLLVKFKSESARSQHNLLIQTMQHTFNQRRDIGKNIERIKAKMKQKEDKIVWIQEKLGELAEMSAECKNINEALLNKDKNIEKNFRKDFQDYSSLVQEQSFKLYKKMPKANVRNINMVSVLIELGACCASQEKTEILTPDCLDYLKSVDTLDQYVGVPNTIDESMYKLICKHRRYKIENEIRLKANSIEQAEIDNSIQHFQKLMNEVKESNVKLNNELAHVRKQKLELIHDKKIQIVVKQGFVEISCSGVVQDFENVIMVERCDVERINDLIRKAGERKLKVMMDKMLHKREILKQEWEHKRMKMEIEDLRDYLNVIQHVKLTKEIQRYLKQRTKGEQFDKGMLTLDQEIEVKKKSYEKILNDRILLINELDKQIKDYKKKNKVLDQQIAEINVDVCEQQESRDMDFEKEHQEILQKRMTAVVKRSKLIKQIQEQHNEIMILQAELELLRLKTYPTLKFKTL